MVKPPFAAVADSPSFPQLEEEVLRVWKERDIPARALQLRAGAEPFVFFEGPPTANGLPHPGHCLTRAIKDLFPRFRTMRGQHCERKAGWDTHGLPVEVEVCKQLGIHSKEEIEAYGVEPFIQLCQQSVWRYMQEWERVTERLGFWIELDQAYVTYHQSFVESVWWSLQQLFERGLLYQGHKIVWWWAQGGTALSSGEVGQGYREVADPSVYVRFPLVDEPGTSLLVWTTTPWTLPSNQFAAVHPDLVYAVARDSESGERLILAEALVAPVAAKAKRELVVERTLAGRELLGRRYRPPFAGYYSTLGDRDGALLDGGRQHVAWRVVAANFVTIDSGTGLVHQAPAFGEVDFEVLLAEQRRFADNEGPELICAVGPDGKFTAEGGEYAGRWVKDCDKDINRELRQRGLLFHLEQYLHDYPFCWRADDDPLIQYPRRSWFIRTTAFKQRMLDNNQRINWLPDHIRDGRFGNFLESNVDWALSRERYWGTPLPIWVCEQTGQMEAIGSYQELLAKPGVQGREVWESAKQARPELPDDLRVHKPYIDAVTYASPFAPGARMRRVPEVIDCWYDSGAMPFAQWGYPHQGRERFEAQFPADFISEALDQTRGWFYSLLAISTLLFDESIDDPRLEGPPELDRPHPFRNCIVLGLMLAESYVCDKEKCDGRTLEEQTTCPKCGGKLVRKIEKMSKRLRNYREPQEIFNTLGADALRWYFLANQPPWNSIIYSERAIKESSAGFRLTLWNVFKFFTLYANIDGFDPAARTAGRQAGELTGRELAGAVGYRPVAERGELDRWILSELSRTCAEVATRLDAYDNYGAARRLDDFLDGLSNWWLRRSRRRFWDNELPPAEKDDAYWTLFECLTTFAKLLAPFTPFLAETLWRNLAGPFQPESPPAETANAAVPESVHFCRFPEPDAAAVDERLSERMELLRQIASLGRSARTDAKLKVRQPLARVEVVLADAAHRDWLESHSALLAEELNVKRLEFIERADQYIEYLVQPNFKRLGPRVGKRLPQLKAALAAANGAELLDGLRSQGRVRLEIEGETIELDADDLQVRLQAKAGWAAAQGDRCVVVLNTEITPELRREGLAKDLNRIGQDHRKTLNCGYTDRIEVGVVTDDAELRQAIEENLELLRSELLAPSILLAPLPGVEPLEAEIGGAKLRLYVRVRPA